MPVARVGGDFCNSIGPKQTWAIAPHMSAFGGKVDMTSCRPAIHIHADPRLSGEGGIKRGEQWRQHTKASVFAERFMWKFRANRKQWDIAIANHADPGQLPRSMLSLFGSPTPCGLLQVRNTLPRFKRPNSVNGNTARNAVAIS